MSATRIGAVQAVLPRYQGGVAAIEFALLALVFFMVVFGAVETARMMYIFNTVQESTRRAASAASRVSHRDSSALERIRQDAVLRTSPGNLVFGAPVSDQNVRIDYLALVRNGNDLVLTEIPESSLPTCPRQNRMICMNNPNAANCIRFVRARICEEGSNCNPVRYTPIIPLLSWTVDVPRSTTIHVVESLGSLPEGTPCL